MRRQCRRTASGRNRGTGNGQRLERVQWLDGVIGRSNVAEEGLDHEGRRGKANEMASRMGDMDQLEQDDTCIIVILGAIIVRYIAVRRVRVGRGRLAQLVDIAHGGEHRIGYHRAQQHDQRREAQVTAEVAQGA